MKKILWCAAALLLPLAAWAVINLDSAKVRTYAVGGVAISTGDKSSAVRALIDYQAQKVTVFHAYGSGAFSPDAKLGEETFIIDVEAGTVSDGSGQLIATLSPAQKTSIQNTLKGQRNALENFLLNVGATQGTQTAW